MIQVDKDGNFLHQVPLSIPSKGNGKAEYFTFKTNGATLYVAGAYFSSNQRGGDPSLGISKVVEGKEVAYMQADNEALKEIVTVAPKGKVKFKKEKYLRMDKLVELPSGVMVFFSSYNRGTEADYYAAQFTKAGELVACYAAEGIEAAYIGKGGDGLGGHQEPIVVLKDNKLYWLARRVPAGTNKGVLFDTDVYDLGYAIRTTVTTIRNDETYQLGSLVIIDTENRQVSNQIVPEDVLVGAMPLRILPNGNVILNALDIDKKEYKNLFITQ